MGAERLRFASKRCVVDLDWTCSSRFSPASGEEDRSPGSRDEYLKGEEVKSESGSVGRLSGKRKKKEKADGVRGAVSSALKGKKWRSQRRIEAKVIQREAENRCGCHSRDRGIGVGRRVKRRRKVVEGNWSRHRCFSSGAREVIAQRRDEERRSRGRERACVLGSRREEGSSSRVFERRRRDEVEPRVGTCFEVDVQSRRCKRSIHALSFVLVSSFVR